MLATGAQAVFLTNVHDTGPNDRITIALNWTPGLSR